MLRANPRITINAARIKQLSRAAVTALEKTGEALHTEIIQAQVMPRDTGALQNENTFVDCSHSGSGAVSISSSTPYARRLYYHPEYNFRTDENPNAKGEWYEDWLPSGSKDGFAAKAFKELYRREGDV